MRTVEVMYFTDREDRFVNLLIETGMTPNVAKVLVFLEKTPEASSRAIERGTDLSLSGVSMALRYLVEKDWITRRESKAQSKGRPVKIYELAKPIHKIIDNIEKEKKRKGNIQLALVKKLRNYIC